MLLDRLVGFALGWLALAWAVGRPERGLWRGAIAIGLAALVHPSVGLQLAMLLGASWVAWALAARATAVDGRRAALGLLALGLSLLPWGVLYVGQSARLCPGLPAEEFRLLSVELQSPQHMLPHLWRRPQWLAFGCYPILALLALGRPWRSVGNASRPWPAARTRLALLMAVNLAGLVLAWFAVEVLGDLRVTLFQPFRMATMFRGLALVAASGRIVRLWNGGRLLDRARAALLAVGLSGDWMLVVATAVDVASTGIEAARARGLLRVGPALSWGVFGVTLALGLIFLARHDTESGHVPLLATMLALVVLPRVLRGRAPGWNRGRLAWALALTWALPMAALLAANLAAPRASWAAPLIERCRFAAVPTDDIERLAVWCRAHTPAEARFIGPPGPKTFRLWSLRSLAFNRAASPYHAAGLADWAARFRDHVGFDGTTAAMVRAYQADRHGLERRYQALGDDGRAALAIRQGARYVIAAPPIDRPRPGVEGPLELLHVEGRYAVYRVREPRAGVAKAPARAPLRPQARTAATSSAGTG
jgi:hypothetical protein